MLPANRSIPAVTVIPVLPYPNVREATAWLCRVFGFTERLRIGGHRIQLTVGDGAVVAAEGSGGPANVMVRVANAQAHHARAAAAGAKILAPPTDFPYGERQYSVEDLGGHCWTFTQSIADVDPAAWGGELVD